MSRKREAGVTQKAPEKCQVGVKTYRLYIGNTIFALALPGEVVPRLARELAGEPNLEHAVDAERLVPEAVDRI